ncbi:hypothetical protein [Streptomyces sp. NPDC058665]|uniref:hypothetical protein n=1 Tax=Streptomyces sp. NPDC058665 TaxID=3346586 RepID=UPI00364F7A13
MHDALWVAGSVGGVLCLAGHLPSPARQWGPHALALAAMLPMGPWVWGRWSLTAGVAALAVACLWTACVGCSFRRSAEVVNLTAMALLAAMASLPPGRHGAAGHDAPERAMTAPWLALLLAGCWALARAGVVLVSQAWPAPGVPSGVRSGVPSAHPGSRAVLLRESGAVLMVTAMAGMIDGA